MKLFGFTPNFHSLISFFAIAETKEQAIEKIRSYITDMNAKSEDYYKMYNNFDNLSDEEKERYWNIPIEIENWVPIKVDEFPDGYYIPYSKTEPDYTVTEAEVITHYNF